MLDKLSLNQSPICILDHVLFFNFFRLFVWLNFASKLKFDFVQLSLHFYNNDKKIFNKAKRSVLSFNFMKIYQWATS